MTGVCRRAALPGIAIHVPARLIPEGPVRTPRLAYRIIDIALAGPHTNQDTPLRGVILNVINPPSRYDVPGPLEMGVHRRVQLLDMRYDPRLSTADPGGECPASLSLFPTDFIDAQTRVQVKDTRRKISVVGCVCRECPLPLYGVCVVGACPHAHDRNKPQRHAEHEQFGPERFYAAAGSA